MDDWFGVLWIYMLNKLKNVHIFIFLPVNVIIGIKKKKLIKEPA